MVVVGWTSAQAADEIAVIVKTLNSSFWQNVNLGSSNAEKELKAAGKNITISFNGPEAETRIEDEVNMVDNAVNRGVKALVLAPSDPDALVPPLRKAKAAGIPVIIIDSLINGDDLYTSFLATNNQAAGELCAKELITRLGGPSKTGKIAIMSYIAGVGSEIGRVGGFRSYIEKNSKLTIVNTYYSNADMITAMNQTTDVLAANPDLIGIFGANEPTAIGMGRAIKTQGMSGKLVAIGFDGDQNLQGFVRDGTLQGIAVQSSYNMGYLGVKAAMDAIDGKKLDKDIDTGIILVTKDNIDSTDAKQVLY
ncbi:MAG: ABC transporter substrate-binding protein [Planctomycetota bacterium]|jgi:ribose transport system substrate-binding protein|nr:ABC transporter substrate-binding protein [Planctomycetota bacterium]